MRKNTLLLLITIKFTKQKLNARVNKKGLVDKSDLSHLELNTKLAILATKAELKTEQDNLVKLQAFDSSYFHGKNHFEDDGTQNYLVFQPVSGYFKMVTNTSKVTAWKSKGLSDGSIKPPLTSDNSLNPGINYFDNARIRVKFDGNH